MEIVVSLLLTIIEFGLFPIIWAYTRSDTITAKKYRWICFGVNLAINLVLHVLITSSAAGFYSAAYMLWTFVFTAVGVKILQNRNLTQSQEKEVVVYCANCGLLGRSKIGSKAKCPNCHKELSFTEVSSTRWNALSDQEKKYFCDSWGIKTILSTQPASVDDSSSSVAPKAETIQSREIPKETIDTVEHKQETEHVQQTINLNKKTDQSFLFCRKCGARIPTDSLFCQRCGEKVVRME